MKKFITIAVCAMLIFIEVHAQSPTFGVNAGFTLSSYTLKVEGEKSTSKSKVGFTGGVVAGLPLGGGVSFRPALNFTQMGGVLKESGYKSTTTMNFIELPLNFVYKVVAPASSFFAGLGPSLAYGISGKYKDEFDGDVEEGDINFGSGDDDDLKPFNVGGNVIVGFEFAGGLFIAANYNLGLSNLFIDGDKDNSFKTGYAGLRVGFMFGGKKMAGSTTTVE